MAKEQAKVERKRKEVKSDFATPWMDADHKQSIGAKIEGTYLGFDNVPIKAGETFKSHRLQQEGSEEIIGLSGATIDQKLKRVPVGTYIWVTYKGQTLNTSNGKAHDYLVEVEDTIPLARGGNNQDSEEIPF